MSHIASHRTPLFMALFLATALAQTTTWDFEKGLDGWKLSPGENMSAAAAGAARTGSGGLRVTDDDPKAGSSLASTRVPVKEGTKVRLTCSARMVKGQGLGIYLRFFDGSGKLLSQNAAWVDGKPDWGTVSRDEVAPAGTSEMDVWIHSGVASILVGDMDDLVLTLGGPTGTGQGVRREALPAGLVPTHPRLLIREGGWVPLKARLLGDEIGRLLYVKLISNAVTYLDESPIAISNGYSDILRDARAFERRVTALAMAWNLEKDPRFLRRAKSELEASLKLDNWGTNHYLDAGEMLMGAALAYDWLYHELTPAERGRIRDAMLTKAMDPAREIYDQEFDPVTRRYGMLWWYNQKNNWSSVCHAGQVAAALAMAEDMPDRSARILKMAPAYMELPLSSYEPLGAYPEGPGYWGYGTITHVLAAAMFETATGTDRGLLTGHPGFSNTVMFELHMMSPGGPMYNYADVSLSWYCGVSPLFGFLGQRYGKVPALQYHRDLIRQETTSTNQYHRYHQYFAFNIPWFPVAADLKGTAVAVPLDAHFPGEADVAVFRSAWGDTHALYLGFKAGLNGAGHGHQDLGSFLLDADNVRWSCELGADKYSLPGYFGPKRDSYFRANNLGHSTLCFNDVIQKRGEGKIIHFESGEKKSGCIADLGGVHPDQVESWKRHAWMLDRKRVVIQDEIEGLKEGIVLHWQMVTPATLEIAKDGRSALLRQEGKSLIAEILEPAAARFDWIPATPPTAVETPNDGFRILRANLAGASGKVRMSVRLTPGDRAPAVKDGWIFANGKK